MFVLTQSLIQWSFLKSNKLSQEREAIPERPNLVPPKDSNYLWRP